MYEHIKDGCRAIMEKYKQEIKTIDIHTIELSKELERGITICKTYIQRLREKVLEGCIQTQEEEIYFFKHIKPLIVGECLFFSYLQRIEQTRNQCAFHEEKGFLLKRLSKFTSFLKHNQTCHNYYKKGKTKHDKQYFIRCNLNADDYNYHPYSMMDSDFATCKDYLFADFYAHEKIKSYLEEQLMQLELKTKQRIQSFKEFISQSPLQWTGNQVDYIELIYALKASKSVNNGKVDIKELSDILCVVFNLRKLDTYRIFVNIKNRQKDKTVFLNYLKDCLERKIEEDLK